MIKLWLLPAWMFILIPLSASAVYRCENADGVTFSDHPCGDNAARMTIRDNRIGGSFGDNLPEPVPDPTAKQDTRAKAKSEDTCRFINSTELRTYLARDQVVKGMTKEHVLKAFGRPPETYPVPQETWVYQTDYYGKLYELTYVYFRDGCVESVQYRKP